MGSERYEFNLEQGWAKGLSFAFENQKESANLNLEEFFRLKQVHGNDLYDLYGQEKRGSPIADADAFRVSGKEAIFGKGILIRTADCCPLVYVDRESEEVVLMHAGWRGLKKGIHRLPFEKGICRPEKTWIWLGPCLTGECFEVQSDMKSGFSREDDSNVFTPHPSNPEKWHFHTWTFLEKEFESLDVEMFYNLEVNTYLDENFASYRRSCHREEKLTQQNYSWLMFKK